MEISPNLDEQVKEPLYIQLYQYFREEIRASRISSATRLPSIRQLANDLAVSKTTVQMAYQQLLAEGYIESKERSGFFAVELEGEPFEGLLETKSLSSFKETKGTAQNHITYDFYMSNIDLEHFPFESWRRCSNQTINSGQKELLFYGNRQGEPGLRFELCKYLRQSRAVNCSPEQIVIGAGTQMMIQTLCQLIGLNETEMAIEEPGYQSVRHVFHKLRFRIHPIPLEEDGLNIDMLAKSKAKAVYITPSHQYPLGMVMPIAKRLKLLQWAEENNGLIIEDDYDGEFRYRGRPIPSLQGLDNHGNVIYIGTFSKSLIPAIRCSYMVLPKRLLDVYHSNFLKYDQTVSRLHQKTLQLFMESGEWERHIRRMRTIYQQKHTALLETVKSIMKDHVKVTGQNAGLHIVMEVKSNKTADDLVTIAEKSGVKIYSTTNTWMNQPEPYPPLILLGFGGLSVQEIKQGIERLHNAWIPYYV